MLPPRGLSYHSVDFFHRTRMKQENNDRKNINKLLRDIISREVSESLLEKVTMTFARGYIPFFIQELATLRYSPFFDSQSGSNSLFPRSRSRLAMRSSSFSISLLQSLDFRHIRFLRRVFSEFDHSRDLRGGRLLC